MQNFYMPVLKFKQAEYMALSELSEGIKNLTLPLFELPPITYDFEEGKTPKTLEEQIEKNAKYLAKRWANRAAFIDGKLIENGELADGSCPLKLFFEELPLEVSEAVLPTVSLGSNKNYKKAVKELARKKGGVCFRIYLVDYLEDDFETRLDSLISYLGLEPSKIHFVLDLETPENFSNYENFAGLISSIFEDLPYLNEWLSITLCGSSFPKSMTEIKGPAKTVTRSEWLLYKHLLKVLPKKFRKPNFGDYGIDKTEYTDYQPKFMRGSASIKYTIDDAWYITKGTVLKTRSDFTQFIDHSKKIMSAPFFSGASFSEGDKKLAKYAGGKEKGAGNTTTWKRIGFNHHFTKVVNDLSATPGASLALL